MIKSLHFVLQKLSSITVSTLCHLFRCACHHHITACLSAFGAEVDDVVGTLDDVHVVFDDDEGVATGNQGIEGIEEFLDVVEMQAWSPVVGSSKMNIVGVLRS